MNRETRITLLERLRDGADPMAWDEFFDRYWPMIYGLARHRGCSHQTAEEVVQDVMLKVFQQRDVFQYDPARGRFRDWLSALVRNKVAEYRRRPSERTRPFGGDAPWEPPQAETGAPEPDAAWEAVFEQCLLMTLLDVLRREMTPEGYLAFELLALHEVPWATVAQATGLSKYAIYRTRKKALRRLRQLAGRYVEEGQLVECVRQSLRSRPGAAVERSLAARIEKTMQSRWGEGSA